MPSPAPRTHTKQFHHNPKPPASYREPKMNKPKFFQKKLLLLEKEIYTFATKDTIHENFDTLRCPWHLRRSRKGEEVAGLGDHHAEGGG